MAVGALAGGYFARMAVRVGQSWVRKGVVVIGFVIFIVMLWKLRSLSTTDFSLWLFRWLSFEKITD